MIKFKEFLRNTSQVSSSLETDWTKRNMRLSDLGAVSFNTGKTDKNALRTPHYEIGQMLEMYETLPLVNSALNQLIQFLIPNKQIKITSSDPKTVKFIEEWHSMRPQIIDEYRNILLTNMICGNGYVERSFAKTSDNESVLDNIFSVNDASRIYVNPDSVDGKDAFIFELPIGIKRFKYMGEVQTPGFYKVQYIKNYNYMMKQVYGIPIPSFKMSQYASGWSRDNLYGRSTLVSAIDAVNVFKEILSSWDTIAKTRQIDKKLISVADAETGVNVDQKRLDALGDELEQTDKSVTLINVPLKMVSLDIETSGKYDLMENVFESLRRMIMMGLLPQHLTPWSDSATTQGSEAAMPPFLGRIKAKQNEFVKFLNENVIDELRSTYDFLADDASFVFEEPKIMPTDYYIRQVTDLVNSEILDKDQARLYLTKLGIIDEDVLDNEEDKQSLGKTIEKIEQPLKATVKEANKQIGLKADVGFKTFLNRLKTRDPKIDTKGWKELQNNNIGGKVIRLIKVDNDDTNTAMLFDGLNLIDTYDLNDVEMKTIKQAYNDYKDKLKKMQDNFEDEETPEDVIIDELDKEVKNIMTKELDKLFKTLDKHQVKKEGFSEAFFSDKILGKLGGLFSGFSKNINKSINNALTKLNLTVLDDEKDGVKVNDHTKDMLKRKKDLMKKNLQLQMSKTKDNMLKDIKSQVINGMAAGKTSKQIKSEIEDKFNYEDGSGWKVKRLIRGTMRDAATLLKLKKWDNMGFENFEWITRDDSKVRPSHQKKNHRVFSIKKALQAKHDDWDAYPGKAANCRCVAVVYD